MPIFPFKTTSNLIVCCVSCFRNIIHFLFVLILVYTVSLAKPLIVLSWKDKLNGV